MNLNKVADEIAEEIKNDILDRSGIGDELSMIDDRVMKEIRSTWISLIMEVLNKNV